MDYYSDDDGEPRRWPKVVIACLVGALVVGGGVWLLTRSGNDQTTLSGLDPAATAVGVAGSGASTTGPRSASSAVVSVAGPTVSSTTASAVPRTTALASPPVTSTGTASTLSTGAASAPSSTAPSGTTPEAADPGYPTSADGTPLPIIATFDVDTITLTGFVPSQAAKDRLGELAIANSKTPARLENNLVINPAVPLGVGVRVIELNSVRFPEASAEILPEHATELARVANVMQALPNVTALVIGHADQRGDDVGNYEISAERAEAVVEFLTYLGVSPTRLSSRAVGEADLLTLGDDDTALALNRRTEFILYGLLIE